MRLRIFVEPQQGASYETLRAAARGAEDAGFDAFFRSDHYLKMGGADGLPGPTDAWTTLAGLARDTATHPARAPSSRSATFRLPGPLAITVAQVDEMSGGRVELGLGAGWYDAEHTAYAIPFPGLGRALRAARGAAGGDRRALDHAAGRDVQLFAAATTRSPTARRCRSRCSNPTRPSSSAAAAKRRTPRLAATYAQEYNAPFMQPDAAARRTGGSTRRATAIGRDPATPAAQVVAVTVVLRHRRRRGRAPCRAGGLEAGGAQAAGACGTPEEVVDRLAEWRDAGAQVAYLQLLDPSDLDHIELLGSAVAPTL